MKHLEFRSGINLLIGDNSSGKTSIIRACNYVTNAFFCGFSDDNTIWKSIDDNDFRLVVGEDNIVLPEKPMSIEFHLSQFDLKQIKRPDGSIFSFDYEQKITLEKHSKKNSRKLTTGLSPLKGYCSELQKSLFVEQGSRMVQLNALPVYACFTTEDIHASRKIDKEKFLDYNQKPSFGYNECFDCRGLFDYWLNRLLVLKEAEMGETEINTVRNALKSALGSEGCNIIDDIIIRPVRGKVFFKYVDGRLVESDMLSDGFKRLVNIVLDVAIRCSLLNKAIFGEDSYKHTHGTVIIDEIDEHLHPALQNRILKDLHRTFPCIQFIVSTHAPMVISSVESGIDNVVYRLWYDDHTKTYLDEELNTYGLDANLILEESMMVDSRDPEVKKMLSDLQVLVSSRKIDEAKILLYSIEKVTSPNQPELVKIRSVINRLESSSR